MHSLILYAQVLGNLLGDGVSFIPGFIGPREVWDEHFRPLGDGYWLLLSDALSFGRAPKPGLAYTVESDSAEREMSPIMAEDCWQ